MTDRKFFKNIFKLCEGLPEKILKFSQIFVFLTFVIFLAECLNKHFRKLDKSLRNFCS